jgi:chemotaxis protein methyltransferase CheR
VDQFNGALRETLIAPARPEPNKERLSESAWAKTWLETVQRASDRIQALTERPAAEHVRPDARGPSRAPQTATQLPLVLELLKQERFSDALDLLGRLPAESALDPDIMLLRAALLTHSGQLGAAEDASKQLLEYDELNTGAHYLLALCRESAGDSQGALEHDRAAVYLDPSFAMPRLHLGLMARRAGDTEAAHRELGQALVLLKREDTSRLLLFGGGFGRDALIALCLAELKSGGQS